VGGPDSGRSALLAPPGLAVGRSPGVGLRVADDAMSRVHLTFAVTPSGVTVDDGASTNGVVVDGRRTEGPTSVDTSSTIVVGASTLALRRRPGAGLPVTNTGDGRLTVRPSHLPRPVDPSPVVTAPVDPGDRRRTRVPWVGALVPIPVAGLLAVLLGPQMLAFALLGPTVMLGSALADRLGAGREHREARAAHRVATAEARTRLDAHLTLECARRRDSRPDPHRVLQTAEHRHPGLWQHPGPQRLRLGLGDLPAEVTWVEGPTSTRPTARLVPVTVDLLRARRLGVVGDRGTTDRVISWLIGQLAVDVPPSLLRIGVATSDPSWNWVRLLPHWWDTSDAVDAAGTDHAAAPVTFVVVAPDPGSLEGAPWAWRPVAGALVIVAATTGAALAGGCGAVLTQRPGRWRLESDGGEVSLSADLVGAWWVDRLARALAPLRPAAEPGSTRALPRSVSLAEVLAVPEVTAETVAASWGPVQRSDRATPRPPVAPVGLSPGGVLAIDLVRDGPHVLVGGTTGSGKSEFLRTLVTSLSVRCPPEDLTFVLVDFKGGSAFGSCARLPHVVGVVTDLDEQLVDRALRSLGAELRRRERLFADAGARDLAEFQLRRAADSEPVPRLVVVIDELRALVDELPHFVSGLVRLAALGRSLGVHLVLATQRPAGAVTAEVQANVNLRIAFRMRDRADSMDVLDDVGAAELPSDVPGRAMARGGDGHVATFQAAALSHSAAATGPWLQVRPSDPTDRRRSSRRTTGSHRSVGPGSLDHAFSLDAVDVHAAPDVLDPAGSIVDAIVAAHSGRGGHPPRAPWLAPLPTVVGFSNVREPGGCRQGVALLDQPDRQLISALGPPQGTWLLSGPPGSGRTTAALGVALASATAEPATDLHLHVIGTGGALRDLDGLHHLGTRLRVGDHTTIRHLVRRLRAEVDHRLGAARDHQTQPPQPAILMVVDGWDQLVESQPDADHDQLADDLVRLLRDGASVGVRGVVTGGRSLLQPRWAGLGADLFLLGAIDAL
ncbi:MAG: FtsK/SpoIIIE domain-containing protein, partial [Ornithinibacter sp.]